MEVQVLNSSGNVVMSTNGFMPEKSEDYKGGCRTERRRFLWQGRLSSGEKVMAATTLIKSKQSNDITLGGCE